MARVCEFCGRGPKKAANRSHSKVKTLRTQAVNLQKLSGFNVCARCRRTAIKQAMKTTATA